MAWQVKPSRPMTWICLSLFVLDFHYHIIPYQCFRSLIHYLLNLYLWHFQPITNMLPRKMMTNFALRYFMWIWIGFDSPTIHGRTSCDHVMAAKSTAEPTVTWVDRFLGYAWKIGHSKAQDLTIYLYYPHLYTFHLDEVDSQWKDSHYALVGKV